MPQHSNRFQLIDGLRGIAALAVVFFHLNEAVSRSVEHWAPAWLDLVFRYGNLGVDVFFVISGFVIAYSVRNAPATLGFLGKFALRRSIRLDPPYWATIALEASLIYVGLRLIPSLGTPLPSVEAVVAHLFYAQNLLGLGNIVPIFWTLCYEIQFYLAYVGGMILLANIGRRIGGGTAARIAWVVLPASFAISIAIRFGAISSIPGLAIDRWYQFMLGCLVFWCVAGKLQYRWLYAAWLVVSVTILSANQGLEGLIVVFISAGVFVGHLTGHLEDGLSARPIQFLGRISYSLYLVHASIGWRLVSLGQMTVPAFSTVIGAWILFLTSVAVSIVFAYVWWRLLERPSIALSKSLGTRRAPVTVQLPDRVAVGVEG